MKPATSKNQQPIAPFTAILFSNYIQGKALAKAASTVTAFAMLIGCAHLPLGISPIKKSPESQPESSPAFTPAPNNALTVLDTLQNRTPQPAALNPNIALGRWIQSEKP